MYIVMALLGGSGQVKRIIVAEKNKEKEKQKIIAALTNNKANKRWNKKADDQENDQKIKNKKIKLRNLNLEKCNDVVM